MRVARLLPTRRLTTLRRVAAVAGLPALLGLSWLQAGETTPATKPAAPTAIPAYRQANTVAVLTIQGPIDRITLYSLERRVERAAEEGADAIVLEIDTPGGALEQTLDICHLIRTDAPANTVAWINPKAYSAGTIIALACREIVVAPGSSFGDAAPISPFGPIPITERAKIESPLLAEVTHSARRSHYDEKLVQGFVSVGVELWMIEDVETGERFFVDRQEYGRVFDEDPPTQLTPVAPPADRAAPQVTPWFNRLLPAEETGEAEALDAEQLRMQIELEQDLPSSRPQLTRADRGRFRPIRQVVASDRLLVVMPSDAIEYGLAAAVIADDEQLKRYFGAQKVVRYDRAWSESLVRFLINPIVMGVLIVVFLVGLFVELAAPGFGVFGAASGISLLILIGAPWLAGMAQWWEILLIGVGILLIGVELFIIPGFGVAGVVGAACLLVGLVGTFVSGDLRTPAGQTDLLTGLAATLTAFFAAGVAFWLLFRQLDTVPLFARFVLHTEVGESEPGTSEGGGLLEALGGAQRPLEAGAVGVAETDLRPAGRASFEGRLVDVKSIGDYIERGTRIRVVSVGRFAIEVEETQ